MTEMSITTDGDIVQPILNGDEAVPQRLEGFQPVVRLERTRNQRGMVTAEWAVGIIAAAGLAGVLIAVLTTGPVQNALLKVILHFIEAVAGKF
jgi:Protein of unknown function (DUF4244)